MVTLHYARQKHRMPVGSCKLVQDAPKDIPVKDILLYDVDYARLEFYPNLFVSIQGNKTEDSP